MATDAEAGQIIGCGKDGRQIERRHSGQHQHQQMGQQKPFPLKVSGIDSPISHRTPPTDVDLIGNLLSRGQATMTDQTATLFTVDQQIQQTLLRHQSLQGSQSHPVVAGGEIEQ